MTPVRPLRPRWLAAAIATAVACVAQTQGGGPARVGERGPDSLEGTVRLAGNAPFTRALVEPEGGGARVVEGQYRDEIRRLAGAVVRLTGHFGGDGYPGPTLEATSYEILSVDGDRPILGRLERDEAGFRLVSPNGVVTPLAAVSDALAEHEGALVWVVLDARGGVAQYGVLREPL